MTFAGWTLAQMAALFGVGAAIVTGLYLLRMQRRQVTVPFAALWQEVARQTDSRRLWRRLRRLGSWLLQLLLLALVCIALGDPRPSSWLREPMHLAIVIDRSASMGALVDAKTSRLDDAKRRAQAYVAGLGPLDDALVIAAGPAIDAVAPRTSERSVLAEAIANIEAVPGEADLHEALALARSAVGQVPGGRIVVLTDGAYGPTNAEAVDACTRSTVPCDAVQLGEPVDNVAITAFAARRYPHAPDKVEVLAEVRNLGDAPAQVVLDVEADGASLGRRPLSLEPGAVVREILPDLDAARSHLVARLEPAGADASLPGIPLDDVAHAVIAPLRPLEVVLVSDGTNLFLDAALLTLGDHIELRGASADQAREDASIFEDADLVVFDVAEAPLPDALPATNRILFDPWRRSTSPSPIELRRRITRPFLTEQDVRHPALADVVLKDVNIARGTTFATRPGDTVLVRTLGEPIVVLREDDDAATVVIGFDPRQSDLPLRPAFPLLVHNLVRMFESRSAGFVASLPLARRHPLDLRELGVAADGVSSVQVTTPEGRRFTVAADDGQLELPTTMQGVYTLEPLDGEGRGALASLAVNQADPGASDLRPTHLLGAAAAESPSEHPSLEASDTGFGDGPLWSIIVLVLAALVALEWATYHRRLTV